MTPGLAQRDYLKRRRELMRLVAATPVAQKLRRHLVLVPSAMKQFMTYDIPHHFRQNTDFLYLCGFQEPDSLLLLEADGTLPEHKSVLFVRAKDAAKELWEGSRSGVDGAVRLTGVDEARSIDELQQSLNKYLNDGEPFVVWYEHRTPAHVLFHNKYLADFIVANKGGFTEDPKSLLHSLRVVKSSREVALMEKTCDIAANAFNEVMKFSRPGVS